MLSNATNNALFVSLHESNMLTSQYYALQHKLCGNTKPVQGSMTDNILHMIFPGYRQPQCIRNVATIIRHLENSARKVHLSYFDDELLTTMGEETRDLLEMASVNVLTCKEVLANITKSTSASRTGTIQIPFDELRNGYAEIYNAAKALCQRAAKPLDSGKHRDYGSIVYLDQHLDANFALFKECYVALRDQNEIPFVNIGTYQLKDTNARPYDRNYAWPTVG